MTPEAEAEYREFVTARLDQLGRFAYLLCRDWHRAEDAVQISLTKLYLRWDRVALRSPDAYARRMVANELKSQQRRMWWRREHSTSRIPESSDPDFSASHANRMTMIEALARLPHRQRLAVVLRFWEDQSVDSTAEIMRCSPGNVKSQTARGLQTLRGLLAEPVTTQAEGALQ